MSFNNLESQAKQVWQCTNLEEARTLLVNMVDKFKYGKKSKALLEEIKECKSLQKIHQMATDFYVQEFDNTRGLSKRI